ncbi:hypothetical protein E2C01_080399 [Portunus trituberculatus]|uniref:Uncharacterized protein n=1 Tax=Portunus trituberculatus TaxID=210409 RepID=A0A5B7IYB1_PORTR|nr:hypothetical protein [Portunus trituberculatus]
MAAGQDFEGSRKRQVEGALGVVRGGGGGGRRHAWMNDVLPLRMFKLKRVTKRVEEAGALMGEGRVAGAGGVWRGAWRERRASPGGHYLDKGPCRER